MKKITQAISLLAFLLLVLPLPAIVVGLTFHFAPGLQHLPQQLAGIGIAAAFGIFLLNIMARFGSVVWPLREGARLCMKAVDAFAASSLFQKRLFTAVDAHKAYLLLLLLLFPLLALSPTILNGIWTFLAEGFAKNAFVAVIAALLIAGVVGLIGLFYGLMIYTMFSKRQWVLWAPVEQGFLYFAMTSIVYGVSLGYSLFQEDANVNGWKWWLRLWMGVEFLLYITRLFLLIAIDKFSSVPLEPVMEMHMRQSSRSLQYGLGLFAVAGLVFLWQQDEGISHAASTALMALLMVDRGFNTLWPAKAQASPLQPDEKVQGS